MLMPIAMPCNQLYWAETLSPVDCIQRHLVGKQVQTLQITLWVALRKIQDSQAKKVQQVVTRACHHRGKFFVVIVQQGFQTPLVSTKCCQLQLMPCHTCTLCYKPAHHWALVRQGGVNQDGPTKRRLSMHISLVAHQQFSCFDRSSFGCKHQRNRSDIVFLDRTGRQLNQEALQLLDISQLRRRRHLRLHSLRDPTTEGPQQLLVDCSNGLKKACGSRTLRLWVLVRVILQGQSQVNLSELCIIAGQEWLK
mmetsp:Transcript_28387/g.45798  ORF Transcript_28387/g.45798 Transcript_28387/m.45798 type:complete len:251 (+) Transcript_28387:180-932(+)